MTLYNTDAKPKIIPQPVGLMSLAEVTLPEPDETWLEVARKWLSADTLFGEREIYFLTECRRILKAAPPMPEIGKRVARFKSYHAGGV